MAFVADMGPPKKLVAHGLARAEDDPVGKRPRTRSTITDGGREALAAWVQEAGAGPVLEFEQLVRITFADSGTKAGVLANLDATRRWVAEQNVENLATARAYLDGTAEFPQRAAVNQLGGRFLTEFYAMVDRWAQRATEVVEGWPDDPRRAVLDRAAQEDAVRIAEGIGRAADRGDA